MSYPIIYHMPVVYDAGGKRPLGFNLPGQENAEPTEPTPLDHTLNSFAIPLEDTEENASALEDAIDKLISSGVSRHQFAHLLIKLFRDNAQNPGGTPTSRAHGVILRGRPEDTVVSANLALFLDQKSLTGLKEVVSTLPDGHPRTILNNLIDLMQDLYDEGMASTEVQQLLNSEKEGNLSTQPDKDTEVPETPAPKFF